MSSYKPVGLIHRALESENSHTFLIIIYSYLFNKRRVANNRRVWKKYLNLINEGSGTNGGPGIFVTLYKEAFENSHFFTS